MKKERREKGVLSMNNEPFRFGKHVKSTENPRVEGPEERPYACRGDEYAVMATSSGPVERRGMGGSTDVGRKQVSDQGTVECEGLSNGCHATKRLRRPPEGDA